MLTLFADPGFWAALFSVTLIQIALGADNLIIITILASKVPPRRQTLAIQLGLVLAMFFPCIATFVVLLKELGLKDFIKSTAIMIVTAILTGGILNIIL